MPMSFSAPLRRVFLALGTGLASPALAAPNVVADIAPVHGLVSMVMQGVGTPTLLVPPSASPHHISLRPSDARALQGAALVVSVGEELAPWLEKPLQSLGQDAQIITLLDLPGTTLHMTRKAEAFGTSDDKHDHETEHGHKHETEHGHESGHKDEHASHDDHAHHAGDGHDHSGLDPHAWLDPQNAVLWLGAIAQTLAQIDPENAAIYQANATAGAQELAQIQAELASTLPKAHGGYLVFHDAYQYFEARFGLQPAGAISLSDASSPSAGRLAALKQQIAQNDIACIFTEPQLNSAVINALDNASIPTIEIDPLGRAHATGPGHYTATLRAMGQAFASCLAGN